MDGFIDDVKGIVTEGVFEFRWRRIEMYHQLGFRILEEKDIEKAISSIEEALPILKKRTLQRAIQFVRKFPNLDDIPEGKNCSWAKLCSKYLPVHDEEKPDCLHEPILLCKKCRKRVEE